MVARLSIIFGDGTKNDGDLLAVRSTSTSTHPPDEIHLRAKVVASLQRLRC
jgi:hypothetical protein